MGDLTGTRLTVIAAQVLSFSDFRQAYPHGLVLSRETGIYPSGTYEVAPYAGYDQEGGHPFLFGGEVDPRLPPLERVLTIETAGEAVAYPFSDLRRTPVINDSVGGRDIVVFFEGGTLSPLAGGTAAPKRSASSTGVFDPVAGGLSLTFTVSKDVIIDEQTGSSWSILGEALSGPLARTRLAPIVDENHFWFGLGHIHASYDRKGNRRPERRLECQGSGGVFDQDLIDVRRGKTAGPHARNDVLEDVRIALAAVFSSLGLCANVVAYNNLRAKALR